jgi:hypothetical protein
MNIEAIYASRQLQAALDLFCQGRGSAGCEAVQRAKRAIDRIIREPAPDPRDEPHADRCMCRTCYETMLERL